MMMKRLLSLLCGLMLIVGGAVGETMEPTATLSLERKGIALAGGSVYYPQVSGMTDAAVQDAVNARLLATGDIENRLNRLAVLGNAPVGITVDWTGAIMGDVLSVTYDAQGALTDAASTHAWSCTNIDLLSGADVTWSDLFADPDAATAAVEEMLQFDVLPELSAHLENSELAPIPESFGLSATGLTLCYPVRQLSTLSDRAGAITIPWYRLRAWVKTGADTILDRIGATAMMSLSAESKASIWAAVEQGALPGMPIKLGGSVKEAVEKYHLLADPDLYEDGRMIQLEESTCRSAYILTDALDDGWDASIIQGIRADEYNLFGLCTGETTRDDWRTVLGEPDATVTLDGDKAEAYRMEAGMSDYYRIGAYRLRLHADENGVLSSISIIE